MLDLSYIIQDMTLKTTEERKNRFTGESIELTKEEVWRHDAIFQHEFVRIDNGVGNISTKVEASV